MDNDIDILVTLSTFSEYSDEPLKLLQESGFIFLINPYGRRMAPSEVLEMGHTSKGLVAGVEQYSAETLAQLPNLRCISRCGVGIDNIDSSEAERRGITILNTPDEPIVAVAELTVAMILSLLRQLPKVDSLTHERKWQRVTGHLLQGKTVGIIGLGQIGRRVAEIVQAFGAVVIGVDPHSDDEWTRTHGVEILDFPRLLAQADIVSIHASTLNAYPLRLDAEVLMKMKPGAYLINTSRGDMVDEGALYEALASGQLSGAALDVFPDEPYRGPLCDSERVILSPHQSTLTFETRTAMETKAVENLLRHLRS
jgi:D-3-phosphoglycerate dehydrogenase